MTILQKTLLTSLCLPLLALAQGDSMRADIRGGGGNSGKCTIEVEVDGVVEVVIDRDTAFLRTVEGQPASWRRFVCNQRMPAYPNNFRFRGIDGRGRQTLIRTPQQNRGRALIQIEDPKGGRHGYTFDVEWDGTGSGFGGGGGGNRYEDQPNYPGSGGGGGFGGGGNRQNERACVDEVRDRIRDDYNLTGRVETIRLDSSRNNVDIFTGQASARQRNRTLYFDFDCRVNANTGRIRNLNLKEREPR